MQNLIFIGPMGAGKSTVGRAVARRLDRAFFDSDQELIKGCGVDIPTIFEFEGESGFRQRESRMLEKLCQHEGAVLATGGGAILREENRTLLREHGYVMLLVVDIEEQMRRIGHDTQRPLLQAPDARARLESLWAEREPLYRATAHTEILTDARRTQSVVSRVMKHLEQAGLIERPTTRRRGSSPVNKKSAE